MDLTSLQNIQFLLKKHGLHPQKRLGQNFIIDKKVVEGIVKAAELNQGDAVLEIGPGIGTLTQVLAKKAGRVIATEKDRAMVEILKETLAGLRNIEVMQEDILKIQISNLKIQNNNSKFKIIGNLPFYLTAPVIRKFLENTQVQPVQMTLVVQKEVGERICAKPPKMSILANAVQFYADAEIVSYVSKKSFWPQPKVDAAIIKIVPRSAKNSTIAQNMSDLFFKIMKAGFLHPRKQLLNNLSAGLKIDKKRLTGWLQKNNIQPTRRAETLNVDDWIHLTKSFVL